MTKGILIDVEAKEIRPVEFEGLEGMKDHLGCEFVDRVDCGDGNDIWVDDEGLCVGRKKGFLLPGRQLPLMGNGLVTFCDEEGETRDVRVTVEMVTSVVTFIEYDDASLVPDPEIRIISF